jgi:hypothetical protein
MHKPVRCMHQPVMSQADACTYCMGSIVLISSQIYLISSYFATSSPPLLAFQTIDLD